jgi:hypothetical protein
VPSIRVSDFGLLWQFGRQLQNPRPKKKPSQIPLTLTLFQREREQQRAGFPNRGIVGFADRLAIIPPLPLREGRREGNLRQSRQSPRGVLQSALGLRISAFLRPSAFGSRVFIMVCASSRCRRVSRYSCPRYSWRSNSAVHPGPLDPKRGRALREAMSYSTASEPSIPAECVLAAFPSTHLSPKQEPQQAEEDQEDLPKRDLVGCFSSVGCGLVAILGGPACSEGAGRTVRPGEAGFFVCSSARFDWKDDFAFPISSRHSGFSRHPVA